MRSISARPTPRPPAILVRLLRKHLLHPGIGFLHITDSFWQIRFLRPDIALVHVTGYNQTPQGENTKVLTAIMTMVMMKEAEKWKIVSFQNPPVENVQGK